MADDPTVEETDAPVAAEPVPANEPVVLNVAPCPVCLRNAVDGVCAHCGADLAAIEAQTEKTLSRS